MNQQLKHVSTYKRSFNRLTVVEILQACLVFAFLLGALALESFIINGTV